MKHECTQERFLDTVKSHKIQIIVDDGIYRHLIFSKGSFNHKFELITWPGHLCIAGDMGTYIFKRIEDMFCFFRSDKNDGGVPVNPGYWGEKLQAISTFEGYKKFSEEDFKAAVMEHLIEWIRENRNDTTKEERRDLLEAVRWEVLGADGDSGGYRKQIAANDFSYHVNDKVGEFRFHDFWEVNVEKYTYQYIWCLRAIVWGIQQYDKAKEKVSA